MRHPAGEHCKHQPIQSPALRGMARARALHLPARKEPCLLGPGSPKGWKLPGAQGSHGGFILTHAGPPAGAHQVLSARVGHPALQKGTGGYLGGPTKVTRAGCATSPRIRTAVREDTAGYVSVPAAGTWPPGCPRSRGRHGSGWRAPDTPPPCRPAGRSGAVRVSVPQLAGLGLRSGSGSAPARLGAGARLARQAACL